MTHTINFNALTHVVAKLQVVEVASKEILLIVVPELPQLVETVALALLQRDQLVDHRLQSCA